MPTAARRQRAAPKPRSALSQQGAANIANFTRVSKSIKGDDLKKDVVLSRNNAAVQLTAITPTARKRKAQTSAEDGESSADESTCIRASSTSSRQIKAVASAKTQRGRSAKKARPAPSSLKRARSPSVSDSEVSTINTDKLFKRLRIESSPARDLSSRQATEVSVGIPTTRHRPLPKTITTVPQEVLSLVDLHASLLKILTLHYAHNGTNVPADLRLLCPNINRAWGKKKVTEADIQLCIGTLNHKSNKKHFSLSNYGHGKICVEIDRQRASDLLDEDRLNELFRSNVEALWAAHVVQGVVDIRKFMENLPKENITTCESLTKATPFLGKGQKRFDELKQGIAAKQQEKDTSVAAAAAGPAITLTNPDGSKMSLLDRIRHKQLQKASAPAGLTPAQLERRAALQRLEEVAALVNMLSRASSAGMGRISFTMAATLEKLKDSCRMGISREEGAACIRLLGKEVAPEWIRVVTVAGRENVVIETMRQVSKAEMERRVLDALTRD